MTMAEVHVAVREALRGSRHSKFLVVVESAELHPGRVDVEWRISVGDGEPVHHFRGRNPYQLLAMLRARLNDERREGLATEAAPELAAVGAPPEEDRS